MQNVASLEAIIRNNPGATAYVYDGDWELVAAEDPNIIKPHATLAQSGSDGAQPEDLIYALARIAGINVQIG